MNKVDPGNLSTSLLDDSWYMHVAQQVTRSTAAYPNKILVLYMYCVVHTGGNELAISSL